MAHFHDGVPMEWLILCLALFLKQLLDERVGELLAQHQFCHSYLVAVGCQVVEGDETPYTRVSPQRQWRPEERGDVVACLHRLAPAFHRAQAVQHAMQLLVLLVGQLPE